jgi:hypothetical protein
MKAHNPDMVLSPAPGGMFVSRCRTCGEQSRPSAHKPAVQEWQREHIKLATTIHPGHPEWTP